MVNLRRGCPTRWVVGLRPLGEYFFVIPKKTLTSHGHHMEFSEFVLIVFP